MPFDPPHPGRPGPHWQGIVLIAMALVLIAAAYFYNPGAGTATIAPETVINLIDRGQIVTSGGEQLILTGHGQNGSQSLSGYYKNPNPPGSDVHFRSLISPEWNQRVLTAIEKAGYKVTVREQADPAGSAAIGFLPIAMFVLVLFVVFMRRFRRRSS